MKLKIYIPLLLLLVISTSYAQVGIGTTSPHASSMLDITSTNSGLLIPRIPLVSASDVSTISSPITSLLVYNSGFAPNGYYYWNGSLWVQLAVGSNTDWSLTGNTGTNSSTNFLGTTDDVDIVFKRFNVRAAFIGNPNTTSGNMNTSFGANSLLNPSGTRNVAVGTNVLPSNSTGNRNTSVGERSMFTNTTGSFNTAFGAGTLFSNLSGDFNTAIGRQSLTSNSFGLYNTALGNDSGYSLTNGSNNIFIGYRAGYNETGSNKLYIEYANLTTDSSQNNAIIYGDYGVSPKVLRANAQLQVGNPSVSGYAFPTVRGTANQFLQTDGAGATTWASASNDWSVTGNSGLSGTTNFLGTIDAVDVAFRRSNAAAGKIGATSTAFGVGALSAGVATNSTAIGNNALSVSTGNNNVAIGQNALQNSASTAQWNTAIGTSALRGINNAAAQDNVAIGFEAMGLGTGNISNTTAVGSKAMQNSTGGNNTAVGNFALAGAAGTQTGTENVAVGKSSLLQNVSGGSNTAVGSESLAFNGATSNNVGVGYRALRAGGGNSVAVGVNALISNSGANNTALGYQALSGITTGTGNVAIGYLAGSSETAASSDKLYIENSNANASNALIYGEFNTNIVRVNGTLQISNPASAPGYALPNIRGNNGQVLQTNGAGVTTWVDATTLSITETDPQVSSATSNVVPKWNGTTLVDGVMVDNGTNVGVGVTPSVGNKLEVNGKTKTTNLQVTTGATANYVLQSDATGNASWVNPTTLTITETDPQVSSATSSVVPKWDGTTLVDGVMIDNGTNVGVGVTPSVGNKLEVNGKTKTTNLQMTTGATANYVLQGDATGNASWVDPTTLSITETDPQVSSTTSSVVPKWNGTTLVDGVMVDDGTNVGVGVTPSAGNKLEVNGKTKTTDFQMTTGAAADYVLQSDATGNASWVQNPLNTLSVTRTNLSANQVVNSTGWQKITFNNILFDVNTEFNTGTSRFVATKSGYYEINAGFHTFNKNDAEYYGIGVYKNGTLYQETSAHHYGDKLISRTINCIINLAINDYVEIYIFNGNAPTTIDGFTGKTYFEVKQIR